MAVRYIGQMPVAESEDISDAILHGQLFYEIVSETECIVHPQYAHLGSAQYPIVELHVFEWHGSCIVEPMIVFGVRERYHGTAGYHYVEIVISREISQWSILDIVVDSWLSMVYFTVVEHSDIKTQLDQFSGDQSDSAFATAQTLFEHRGSIVGYTYDVDYG